MHRHCLFLCICLVHINMDTPNTNCHFPMRILNKPREWIETWFTASCSCVRRSAMLRWLKSTDQSAGPWRSRRPQPPTWTRVAARRSRSRREGRSWRNTKTGSLSAATLLLPSYNLKRSSTNERRHSSLGSDKDHQFETFLSSKYFYGNLAVIFILFEKLKTAHIS